jgi:hypothetical protein
MEDLQIEPPDESEQESASGKLFLRIGATFLCMLLGLALVLLGYGLAIFFDLDLEIFNANPSVYFILSLVIWILIGLLMPFTYYTRFFEIFKGMNAGRAVVFILAIGVFIMLHWYILSFATEMVVSVLGIE